MRVLGIESSSSRSGIAIVDAGGAVAETVFEHEQGLLIRLAPAIRELVASAGVPDGIAVSVGPGSFTGLRIGVATAKALAYAWRVPIVGVPTMEALLHTVQEVVGGGDSPVALMIRSRRGEVFHALYRPGSGESASVLDVACLGVEQSLAELAQLATPAITIAGDAVALYEQMIRDTLPHTSLLPHAANYPSPVHVARIGRTRLLRGESDDPVVIAPRYHRRTYVGTD